MRCDSFMGLPGSAISFLNQHETVPEPCPCCKRGYPPQLEKIGSCNGYDEYVLFRHFLNDGKTADEFLQVIHFDSGPVIFLGLKVSDGSVIEWSKEEINDSVD